MVERCKSGLDSEIGVLISKYTLILKKEGGRKEKPNFSGINVWARYT